MVALSVSISASTSPSETASPSCFSHRTTCPSSMVGDRASICTLVAISTLPVRSLAADPFPPPSADYRYITLLHAATTRSTLGFVIRSSALLYGIGTSTCATRSTGASR